MPMQPHFRDGFKFGLGAPKGDHFVQVVTLLQGLAEDAGHDTIDAWVKSDDFDPEDLVNDHGAEYRRTKYKGKHYHNYEWTKDLGGNGQYKNEYRVGLVLGTKTVRGDVEFSQLSARKWWGSDD